MPEVTRSRRSGDRNAVCKRHPIQCDSYRQRGHSATFRDGYIPFDLNFVPGLIGGTAPQSKNSDSNGDYTSLPARNRYNVKRNVAVQCNVLIGCCKIFSHSDHLTQLAKVPLQPQPPPAPLLLQVKMGCLPYTGTVGTGQLFSRLYSASTSLFMPFWI